MVSPSSESQSEKDSVQRILDAAQFLFAKHGFDAVSVNAIAAMAGVSKANVFHHFTSKRELHLAVMQSANQKFGATLNKLGHEGADVVANLENYAKAHLGSILENEQLSRLVLRDVLENAPEHSRELAGKIFGNNFARLVGLLRNSQESGALKTELDPAMIAVMLIGANVFFFEAREVLRHFTDVNFVDKPEQYSHMLVDILLNGILPVDGSKKIEG
ncbi:TetR/AcrR family transcriptional regulator [Sulfurirhabdus autotrophica]|uniref:TetR family transcriptional regulator n=1 Tax=Sulfurirhabdus autotrophica TaxID=1706046 RepID=A0A4R3Y403_9PROT|nr:TetR/AcrR family transcriptional regulator [Sulfurirhabdus autotrophica]TCV86397.1 TetR family transcriptional regulator [Sulfurirhabdus autotrophica]